MKSLTSFFFWFFLILLITNIGLFLFINSSNGNYNSLKRIASPLPQLFDSIMPKDAKASDFWAPNAELPNAHDLQLTALSALSYDMTTNKIIYAKDIEKRRPIASLTKIMTAIIALENINPSKEIKISKSAAEIGESSMGLSANETYTLNDLMYGLILHSGNDAAEAIAQASSFGRDGFIFVMNKKAEDIGLSNTRFTNPSGLQGDGEQYSTAKELLILTHYALQKDMFKKIASTYEYKIPANTQHKALTLFNETNLLTTYPGVKGVKTGYTDEAGMCLVTYLEYDGHKIIAILLSSENRRQEMKELLDYSLQKLGTIPPQFKSAL